MNGGKVKNRDCVNVLIRIISFTFIWLSIIGI